MRTNTSVDINADWEINQIVKPGHVNALTRSIKYDFVLTAQMLKGKTGDVNVFDVLGISIVAGTLVPGHTHILINAVVPNNIVLCFPGNQGDPGEDYHIHVHFLSGCKVNTSGSSPMIYFYFHSHGVDGAVEFTGIGRYTYVGSFKMATPITLITGARFTYEMALGELPHQPDNKASIVKSPWMSNVVGSGSGGSHAIAVLLHYLRFGPKSGEVPSTNWPLCIRWTATSGASGAIAASKIFPSGTATGVAIPNCLVPRDKPAYNGSLLPSSLLSINGALEFRNVNSDWSCNQFSLNDHNYGFVLNDSFFGCHPAHPSESEPASGVKVTATTTQLDIYTSFGLEFQDTGLVIPRGVATVMPVNIGDMEEGQVVELNIHIVEFGPARQALNTSLGGEHFVGEWVNTATYAAGSIISVTTLSAQGNPVYSFFRSLKDNNKNNIPESSLSDWWEAVVFHTDQNSGSFHAATPFNSGVQTLLRFDAGDDSYSGVPIYSWGYGVPPEITGGLPTWTNTQMHVTFNDKANWQNSNGFSHGIIPTLPIAASAKIIFAKISIDNEPRVLVLTGGYSCKPYPNY